MTLGLSIVAAICALLSVVLCVIMKAPFFYTMGWIVSLFWSIAWLLRMWNEEGGTA